MIALARGRYYLASVPTLLRGVENWPAVAAALLRPPPRAPFVVRLRGGCRFRVTSALDVWLLKEVCLDGEYQRDGTVIGPGATVVDVGAGVGEFCVSVARAHPDARVYAFEPAAESFALLEGNVRLNGLDNVTLFPCAVAADGHGRMLDRRGGAPALGRISAGVHAGPADAVRVPSIGLTELLGTLDAGRCDFLKVDCEGAEYEILLGAGRAVLERIAHIALEYHDDTGTGRGADLAAFLRDRGFAVHVAPSRAYPDRLGLLYATRGAEA